jgi:hypothetical protein
MDFSRSHEGKEENPRNYNGLRARERKNTFHMTLNQRQLLTFGTVYIFICCCFKRKAEAQVIFLNPFTVCSSCKWKFVVCPLVYEETNGSYLFAKGLNGLNGLAHLCIGPMH